ncbi:hypothetical protein [Burkholderia vietnamiensis]|uniref:hypothetical protein n=1 Tax=Burkholderia vietnamiensis TaxID=60552 RepID=UPI00075422E5|nr:hypothetical protein [Burkholderia vietnamiensis]KVE67020.1 hypothetical protein WI97_11390 [Burkholderia vietnamiensis]KVR85873.1 hypothetical protein WK27_15080 [Burkholderia vietnamiensis]
MAARRESTSALCHTLIFRPTLLHPGARYLLAQHMRRPGDEKHTVVILRPGEWEEGITTSNV